MNKFFIFSIANIFLITTFVSCQEADDKLKIDNDSQMTERFLLEETDNILIYDVGNAQINKGNLLINTGISGDLLVFDANSGTLEHSLSPDVFLLDTFIIHALRLNTFQNRFRFYTVDDIMKMKEGNYENYSDSDFFDEIKDFYRSHFISSKLLNNGLYISSIYQKILMSEGENTSKGLLNYPLIIIHDEFGKVHNVIIPPDGQRFDNNRYDIITGKQFDFIINPSTQDTIVYLPCFNSTFSSFNKMNIRPHHKFYTIAAFNNYGFVEFKAPLPQFSIENDIFYEVSFPMFFLTSNLELFYTFKFSDSVYSNIEGKSFPIVCEYTNSKFFENYQTGVDKIVENYKNLSFEIRNCTKAYNNGVFLEWYKLNNKEENPNSTITIHCQFYDNDGKLKKERKFDKFAVDIERQIESTLVDSENPDNLYLIVSEGEDWYLEIYKW